MNHEAEVIDQLKRAEDLARQAREDMMILTHQLQGPLVAAVGALSFIKQHNVEDTVKEELNYVEFLLEDAINLCYGIFTSFAQASGRETSFTIETIDAQKELPKLVKRLQATNARSDLTFVYQMEDGFPLLHIDKDVFISVIYSLIHNAMKYADEHSKVILECSFDHSTGAPILKIKSVGEPIQQEESERIFGKFQRGHNLERTGRYHSGIGLGLWVARNLMRSIGGDLFVELSPQNPRLSIFAVHFPRNT